MLFGLMLMAEIIDKDEDLRSYYNFWQHVWRTDVEGVTKSEKISNFHKQSFFEFQRFLNNIAIIISGGLLLADNVYGALLGILSVGYYALLYMNPWVIDDSSSQQ
jgi:hypothetical protein